MEDFYKTLGVSRDASDEEIKKAYRRLAQKYHPDRNKGNKEFEKKFKEANAAYETLGDKQKRAAYDQFGSAGTSPFGTSGFQYGDFSDIGGGFADVFETFFGASRSQRRQRSSAGEDIEIRITITLEQAAFGDEKEISIERIEQCETCKGSGAKPGTKITMCMACGGKGEVHTVQTTILGQVSTRRLCDTCGGEGKIPENSCNTCHGNGRKRNRAKLTVKLPAGIHDGAVIRLSGQGNAGIKGGKNGDLYIHTTIQPSSQFAREGDDVYSVATIHLLQAVLGDEIAVNTLHGKIRLRIPAGTESNKLFRIKNHGIQKLHSAPGVRGDHFVKINVEIPAKLSKKEKELYQQLAAASGLKIKGEKGMFGKLFE